MANPFRYFNSSPEVIRLTVLMYVRYPLSLRQVEELLAERGIDICHETARFWWNRFGPMFAAEIRKKRVEAMRAHTHWRWHLDEMYVKIRYPLSLRNIEDLLFERGIDICHETVRLWWNRFGPMFAGEIRRKRVRRMRQFTHWKWRLDEVYVKING